MGLNSFQVSMGLDDTTCSLYKGIGAKNSNSIKLDLKKVKFWCLFVNNENRPGSSVAVE